MIYLALIASLLGLCVSWYLHRKKRTKKKLVCPLRANCEMVIHSTHASTLGIPNEVLGIAYYIIIGMLYVLISLSSIFATPIIIGLIVLMTFAGVFFSLYLILIQTTVLRAWCSWCLLSVLANVLLVICIIGLGFI